MFKCKLEEQLWWKKIVCYGKGNVCKKKSLFERVYQLFVTKERYRIIFIGCTKKKKNHIYWK